ncbi:MAG: O-antigen ligase family protein [Cetobacterium sp.]
MGIELEKIECIESRIISIYLGLSLVLSTILGKYISKISNLFILIIFVSLFIYRKKIRKKRIDIVVYIYLFFYLSSILEKKDYFVGIKNWLLAFIFLVIIFQNFKLKNFKLKNFEKQLSISYKLFIKITFLTTCLGIVFFLLKKNLIFLDQIYGVTHYGATTSVYVNPNTFGLTALTSFMLSNILLKIRKNKFYKINIIIQIFGVIISKSRTAALGIVIYILLIIILKKIKKIFKILTIILVSIITMLYSYIILLNKTASSNNFFNGRIELWELGIKIGIKDILGIGTTSKISEITKTLTNDNNYIKLIEDAGFHNIFIQIFVINGGIGLACFVYIFYSLIKKYKTFDIEGHRRDLEVGLYSSGIVMIITNIFESNIFFVSNFMAVCFWSLYCNLDKIIEINLGE